MMVERTEAPPISNMGWVILGTLGATMIAAMGLFWTMTNPKADIDEIRRDYVTIREYEEVMKHLEIEIGDMKASIGRMDGYLRQAMPLKR